MLAQKHKQLIAEFHHNGKFKAWLADIEVEKPKIPLFNPKDSTHTENVWAYYSGMEEGYKLALSHLGVNLND